MTRVSPGCDTPRSAAAATKLVADLGGDLVGLVFLIELGFLPGRAKLAGQAVHSVLQY